MTKFLNESGRVITEKYRPDVCCVIFQEIKKVHQGGL